MKAPTKKRKTKKDCSETVGALARSGKSLLIPGVANENDIIDTGAAREGELFAIARPIEENDTVGFEVSDLFWWVVIERLAPNIGDAATSINISYCVSIAGPAKITQPGRLIWLHGGRGKVKHLDWRAALDRNDG